MNENKSLKTIHIQHLPINKEVQHLTIIDGQACIGSPHPLHKALSHISGLYDCLYNDSSEGVNELYCGLVFESDDQGNYNLTGETINLLKLWYKDTGDRMLTKIQEEIYLVIPSES